MAQDFDIGKQARLDIIVAGAVIASAQLTDFQSKQETITLLSRPIGGPPVRKEIPDGWSGSYGFDRLGPALDDLFAVEEANYWDNGIDASQIFLTETIREKDGSVSQYRYEAVCQKFDDAGNKKQDDKIAQKVSFMASRRRKIA